MHLHGRRCGLNYSSTVARCVLAPSSAAERAGRPARACRLAGSLGTRGARSASDAGGRRAERARPRQGQAGRTELEHACVTRRRARHAGTMTRREKVVRFRARGARAHAPGLVARDARGSVVGVVVGRLARQLL